MKVLFAWSAVLITVLILGAWLAGAVFLMSVGLDPLTATPWTHIEYLPYRFMPEYGYSLGGVGALLLGIPALALWPKGEKVHGDAAWATEGQIRKAGLRASHGILLGKKGGRFLVTDDPAHVLLVAPTRSGKGVGVIIPNLLNFDGSAVVLDIKRENYHTTAGYRHSLHHGVFLWSPMALDGRSHRYNPLAEISDNRALRITELQLISNYLIPVPEKNRIWSELAQQLFTALCMVVLDDPEREPTIGGVYRTLNATGGQDFAAWIDTLVKKPPHWLDPECDRLLSAHAAMTSKERTFARSTLNSALSLWASPLVDAATSTSDFALSDLRKRRMSIYVGIGHEQMSTLQPLLSLFFQQVIGTLSKTEPGPDEPHKVLILLDEFASLGKMAAISSAVTMLAGYGGRLMFVLQGLGTLEEHYGKGGDSILQNCAKQIFFAPNDETTARYVVGRLGRKTVKQQSKSTTKGATSHQMSETGRDLLMPQELRTLKAKEQIVFSEGAAPVRGRKIVYFKDRAFRKRLMNAPEIPKLDLEGRGGGKQSVEMPPDDAHKGAPKAGKGVKVSRKKRRAGLGSVCASAIDDYQAATGKNTLNPVFGHLIREFGAIPMDGNGAV